MIKYTIIKEIVGENGIRTTNNGTSTHLFILGYFLYWEIQGLLAYEFFTSWLKNEIDQDCAYGNVYGLTELNNKVLVHEQEFAQVEKTGEPKENDRLVFVTTKQQMLEVIDDWLKTVLMKSEPFEVKITQDEKGKVEFQWLGGPEKPIPDDW